MAILLWAVAGFDVLRLLVGGIVGFWVVDVVCWVDSSI